MTCDYLASIGNHVESERASDLRPLPPPFRAANFFMRNSLAIQRDIALPN